MKNFLKTLLIVLAIFIVAALIDVFIFSKYISWLSNSIGFGLSIILFGANFNIPKLGAISTLISILVIVFFIIVPYKNLFDKENWSENLRKYIRIMLGILALPVAMFIGAFLYKILGGFLPDSLSNIFESFGISSEIFFGDHKFTELDGSLASFAGLILGLLYVNKKMNLFE